MAVTATLTHRAIDRLRRSFAQEQSDSIRKLDVNGRELIYVPLLGAVGPDGKAWTTPEGVRNTGMTIYKIPMLAEGFKGRPK